MLNGTCISVGDTETQAEIRRAVREFAATEILPHASRWDEEETFPGETVRQLGELGFLGPIFPEQYGGAGFSYTEYAVLVEELARADASVAITVAAHVSLAANHIYEQGTEEQKARFLAPLASGEALGAWSLTEPGAGSDAGGTRTTAVRDGDGWVLNGSKTFTTNGSHADIAICMASTRSGTQAPTGSPPSSLSGGHPVFVPAGRNGSWGTGRRTPPKWSSRTAGCPTRTCSDRWARGSRAP